MAGGAQGERLFVTRFRLTTAVAGAGHLLCLIFIATRPAPVAVPSPVAEVTPILVELESEVPVLPPPVTTREPEPVVQVVPAAARAAGAPRRAPGVAFAAAEGDTGAPGSPGDGASSAGPAPEAPASSVRAGVVPDRLPPPLLPLAVHAPPAVLAEPFGAAQAPVGLTAGAQVMATARKLAEGSGPAQGHGTIRVTVADDGSVSGVVVSGIGWEAAGQRIRAALAGRRFRVPKGARGVVISLAVDAKVTRVPPVLTGEASFVPLGFDSVHGGIEDQHRGFHTGAPNTVVIDPRALAPLQRRVVKVELAGEQVLPGGP